jgi:spore maturation protein SpmA
LCAACIAGLVGACVHGVVDAAIWGIKLAFVPWAVMGLVVGLWEVATKQKGQADPCR